MEIWIFNHYADKPGGTYLRHFDFASQWVEKGHRVRIFASGFTHNRFKYETNFDSPLNFVKKENYNGIDYYLIKTVPYQANDWRRIANMISYFIITTFYALFKKPRPHIIIGSNVHPLAVLAAWIVAFCRKTKFVFEVRDLWPETLINMGFLKENSLFTRFLKWGERFMYRKADLIVVLMPFAFQYIEKLGISRKKIVWIPNSTNLERYRNIKAAPENSKGPFKLFYLGAYGAANGLDVLIRGMKIINMKYPNTFYLHFYGSGPEKSRLERLVQDLHLDNVALHPPVPKEQLFSIMELADAFVFVLRDLPLFRFGISPNKLNDYLSSKRPVIFLCNSNNNIVKDADAGVYRQEISPRSFANAVEELFFKRTSEERKKMGENGLNYIRKNYEIRILADKMLSELLGLLKT